MAGAIVEAVRTRSPVSPDIKKEKGRGDDPLFKLSKEEREKIEAKLKSDLRVTKNKKEQKRILSELGKHKKLKKFAGDAGSRLAKGGKSR